MKPHLLMLLLLAIPPLVANILACENAEKSDAPAAAKSDSLTREVSATPAAHVTSPPAPVPGAAKPAPSAGSGTSSGLKSWNIM